MEMLIAIALLAAVALLAARFGHDSRDSLESKEWNLAAHGMTWSDLHAPVRVSETSSVSQIEDVEAVLPVHLEREPAAA